MYSVVIYWEKQYCDSVTEGSEKFYVPEVIWISFTFNDICLVEVVHNKTVKCQKEKQFILR